MTAYVSCRACCFPLVCKAFSEACEPRAVGNLWSSLAISASTLSSGGEVPYEHRLTWVGARIKQVSIIFYKTSLLMHWAFPYLMCIPRYSCTFAWHQVGMAHGALRPSALLEGNLMQSGMRCP